MQQNNQEIKGINIAAAIEAILFVYGEPLGVTKIAKFLKDGGFGKISKEEIENAITELKNHLNNEKRALILISSKENEEEVQLATRPEFGVMLENFIKEEFKETLSPASLETLALIAYLGPLTRAQIDYYRGVNSSFILRSLLIRGLTNRIPHPRRGNIYLYRTSFDLLKYLGVASVEELPEYPKFRGMIQEMDRKLSPFGRSPAGRETKTETGENPVNQSGEKL